MRVIPGLPSLCHPLFMRRIWRPGISRLLENPVFDFSRNPAHPSTASNDHLKKQSYDQGTAYCLSSLNFFAYFQSAMYENKTDSLISFQYLPKIFLDLDEFHLLSNESARTSTQAHFRKTPDLAISVFQTLLLPTPSVAPSCP